MPSTLLAATAAVFNSPTWNNPTPCAGAFIPGAFICVNSDDPVAGFGSSRVTTFQLSANRICRFVYASLPQAANGGTILDVTIKTTARRAGGSTAGRYFLILRDPVTTNQIISPTHVPGSPGGTGLRTFFDTFPTNPNGFPWTPADINQLEIGLQNPGPFGTGVAVYHIGPVVTWTGAAAAQDVTGV